MELSDKQQAFVQEYVVNGYNASQAYRTAYPGCNSGWDAHGARLVVKDRIKQAISLFQAGVAKEVGVKMQEIVDNARWQVKQGREKDDTAAVARGNEQLGRTIGAYKDVSIGADVKIVLEREQTGQARPLAPLVLDEEGEKLPTDKDKAPDEPEP